MKVIVAIEYADGRPCPFGGQYLVAFDFDAAAGRGRGEFTKDPERARKFADAGEALSFWRTPSTVDPVRDDGKPNRPFTSITVEIRDP
jgi:hypothetical protein